MKNKLLVKNLCFGILTVVLVAVVILVSIFVTSNNRVKQNSTYYEFNAGWKDDKGNEINLPLNSFDLSMREITITNILPNDISDDSSIYCYTKMQGLKVYINDELIYSFGFDGDKLHGSFCNHYIPLLSTYSDQKITLSFYAQSHAYAGVVANVGIGNDYALWYLNFEQNVIMVSICAILILVGILAIVWSLVLYKDHKFYNIIYFGLASILMGFAGMFFVGVFETIIDNTYLISNLAYTLFNLAIVLFLVGFQNIYSKIKFIKILSYGALLSFFVQTILGASGIVTLDAMHLFLRLMFCLDCIIIAIILSCKLKNNNNSIDKLQAGILWLYIIGQISDNIFFTMFRPWYQGLSFWINMLCYLGMLASLSLWQIFASYKANIKLQEELANANTMIMVSQIRPHFLYNALNTIKALCIYNPKMAETAIMDFAVYLRSNMGSIETKAPIYFSKELEHIKSYLKIEKLRFGDRLNIVYDIKVNDFFVPALSIEPLIENAVHHGVFKKAEGGTVYLRTYDDKNYWYVEVEDTGVGFDVESLKTNTKSIGLKNTVKRLTAMSHASLSIDSKIGEGTKVIVTFPKDCNAPKNNNEGATK